MWNTIQYLRYCQCTHLIITDIHTYPSAGARLASTYSMWPALGSGSTYVRHCCTRHAHMRHGVVAHYLWRVAHTWPLPFGPEGSCRWWRKIEKTPTGSTWDDFTLAIPRVDRGKILRYDRIGTTGYLYTLHQHVDVVPSSLWSMPYPAQKVAFRP